MPAQKAPQPNEQEGPRRVPHAFGVPGRSLEPMGLAVSMCSSGALVWASAHLSVLWNLATFFPPFLTQSYLNPEFSCKDEMGILQEAPTTTDRPQ